MGRDRRPTDGPVADSSPCMTEAGLRASSAKWIPAGAVLLAMYGSIGKLGIASRPLTTNQAIAHAVVEEGIVESKYLFWYLRSIRDELIKLGKGGTQLNISQSVIKDLTIPVPPVDEQKRIVEAIEEQVTKLLAGTSTLQRAKSRLHVYRQSALNRLIPSGAPWRSVPLAALASAEDRALAIGPFGSNLKVSDYRDSGVPLIFVRNVRSGRVSECATRYVSREKAELLAAHRVVAGDVLVTKMGDPPGDAAIYPDGQEPAIITADVIKVTVDRTLCEPEFLSPHSVPTGFAPRFCQSPKVWHRRR